MSTHRERPPRSNGTRGGRPENGSSPTEDQRRDANDDHPAITGPHDGYDRDGRVDHWFYRCERCGLESTDRRLQDGCWRCRPDADDGGANDGESHRG